MRVESGPASGDRNYFALVTILCLGLFGWFMRDWHHGYMNKNLAAARLELAKYVGSEKAAAAVDNLPDTFDKPKFDTLSKTPRLTREQVHTALGPPLHVVQQPGGETVEYFASRYGLVTVIERGGQVQQERLSFTPWAKSRDEIEQQFYWGMLPLLLGLYFGYRLYRAVTLKATVDDEGLVYAGQRVRFADMESLRDYSPKGWIDLYHREAGRERKLRLDNQKVQKFDEIVDAICQTKGFPNLVREYAEQKAREDDDAPATPDEPPAKD